MSDLTIGHQDVPEAGGPGGPLIVRLQNRMRLGSARSVRALAGATYSRLYWLCGISSISFSLLASNKGDCEILYSQLPNEFHLMRWIARHLSQRSELPLFAIKELN